MTIHKPLDPMSHLAAVTLALDDEMRQPHPNEAVLAVCNMFLADAVREATRSHLHLVWSQPDHRRENP